MEEAKLSLNMIEYSSNNGLATELQVLFDANDKEKEIVVEDGGQEDEARDSNISSDSYLLLLADKMVYRPLLLGSALQACQQLSGINTIMYYSATILSLGGFSPTWAIWLAAVTALFNVIGTVVGVMLVDSVGRRPLTLASLFLVVVALGLIAMSFLFAETSSQHLQTLPSSNEVFRDHCQQYEWCFDCVQDFDCGMCVVHGVSDIYSCVSVENKSPICDELFEDSCPGANSRTSGTNNILKPNNYLKIQMFTEIILSRLVDSRCIVLLSSCFQSWDGSHAMVCDIRNLSNECDWCLQ